MRGFKFMVQKVQEVVMTYRRLSNGFMRVVTGLLWAAGSLHAATTDISSVPLSTYSKPSADQVRPNIMFVLDNSGSMDWIHMPDNSGDGGSTVPFTYGFYGYRSSQCNGMYYNPATTYTPPVYADHTTAVPHYYPNATFTAAWVDGFNTGSGTTNLSTSFRAEGDSSNQAAYYYNYTGSQKTLAQKNYYVSNTFVSECGTASGSGTATSGTAPGSVVFSKVTVGAGEQQNFANWYSYYRKRINMMKTATGLAFSALDDRFRVGYMNLNAGGTDFINIGKFTSAQKTDWYSALYGASASGSTPTRTALSNAGRVFAKKIASVNGVTVTDPLEYSCQQNYTILSTDGFWNSGSGYKLDGTTTIGNEDGSLPRPYWDGGGTQRQQRTSTLQTRTTTPQLQTRTSQLRQTQTLQQAQQQVSNLQMVSTPIQAQQKLTLLQSVSTPNQARRQQTHQLQISTKSGSNWSSYTDTDSTCTSSNSVRCQYRSTNGSESTWNDVASCTVVSRQNNSPYTVTKAYACQDVAGNATTTSNLTACTAASLAQYTTGTRVTCTYQSTPSNWSNVDTCTVVALSAGPTNYVARSQCQNSTGTATTTLNPNSCTPVTLTGYNTGSNVACSYANWSGWNNVASCTATAQSTSAPFTASPASRCQTTTGTPSTTNVPSCTVTSTPPTNTTGYTTSCAYGNWTSWTNASACTAVPQSTSSPYTAGTAVDCQAVAGTAGPWTTAAGTCTTSSTTGCQYSAWSGWSTVASCTDVAQSSASPYTVLAAKQCQDVSGAGGSTGSLSDVAAYYYNTDLRTAALGNCTGTPVAPATTGNDVCANNVPATTSDPQTQQHMTTYTVGLGVRGRMVYGSPTATSVPKGYNYVADSSGDYYDVAHGTTANSGSGICSWQAGGACNWPIPGITGSDGNIENVDDLWHAAVNGHGYYYSATDPDSLVTSLKDFVSKVFNIPKPGTAAAAASSNPNITSSDNYVFSSSYTSVQWFGEVTMQNLDATLATLSDVNWNAGSLLAQKMQGSDTTQRTIYVNNGGLQDFTWANLSSAQQAYFKAPALTYTSATSGLSQFCTSGSNCLSSTAQSTTTALNGAAGENLVKYLRGDHTYEGVSKFYRPRPCPTYSAVSGAAYPANADHPDGTCVWFTNGVQDDASGTPQPYVLGDIVSSEARYVKLPQFQYTADGYGTFVTEQASRIGMVYVGANDGMLHAFNALTGAETWAYIPTAVLPNLYKLADMNYADNHQFYVDGTPEVGDIFAGTWKTMLVGGLNLGGKSFYALDVTDPANPVYKWEFTDANMGYSFGNPKFGKLTDGTWVLLLTSGYNNADGKGHLYVVNANTGALIRDISTGVGTAASPSGLARIAVRLTSVSDPTIKAAYGGDLLGNVWRFDVNNNIGASGYDAQLMVTLKDASGNVQPITAKPTVTMVGDIPVVYVGTGEFLGVSDIGTTTQQSFYAIKDKLDTTTFGNPRVAANKFVQQTVSEMACPAAQVTSGACASGETVRGISGSDCHAVDWSVDSGWFVDFLTPGERSYTDSALGLGSLVFTTNVPSQSSGVACGTAGTDTSTSFRYTQDYVTGCSVKGADSVVGINLGAGLTTRPNLVLLPDGTLYSMIRQSGNVNGPQTLLPKVVTAPSGQPARRVSWRELFTE